MDGTGLYERFLALQPWTSNGKRAPHKPLLALWAIGRALRGESRMMRYSLVDRNLAPLLDRFGPPRKSTHTEYPFWRMRKDEIWEIDRPEQVTTTRSDDAHVKSLLDNDIRGGLLQEDYLALRHNPHLAWQIAESIIDAHFPQSYRDDILRATGFDTVLDRVAPSKVEERDPLGEERAAYELEFESVRRLKRDPGFRPAVLCAYSEKCAVCAFDVRMSGKSTAVEAAHIHWHADAGPNRVRNGLALCTLHHRLFDRGAFTLFSSSDQLTISVASEAVGTGFEQVLGRFDGMRPRVLPRRHRDRPAERYLRWHQTEVFRGSSQGR